MKNSVRVATVGGIAVLATATFAGTSVAATTAHTVTHTPAPGVVFVQNDSLSGNAIAVYDRASDGTLRAAHTYSTGGLGGA